MDLLKTLTGENKEQVTTDAQVIAIPVPQAVAPPVPAKPKVRFLKKDCFICNLINKDAEKAFPCHTDADCTAKQFKVAFGVDPQKIAQRIFQCIITDGDASVEALQGALRRAGKRSDCQDILRMVAILILEEEKRNATPGV